MIPCEENFRLLAETDPGELIRWVRFDDLTPSELTFAAEHLGKIPEALSLLLTLLRHESPMVREGALCGLGSIVDIIHECMVDTYLHDPSPGCREAAKELTDYL